MKMFIDDERFPVYETFVICRSSDEAIKFMEQNGIPEEISFDHDLGGDDTSIKVINWMENALLDGKVEFPENFQYSVHSQNPIGAANIRNKMEGLVAHFKKDKNYPFTIF